MKVLLLGSRGYLGSQFLSIYPDAVCPSVDIADSLAVAEVLDAEKPDVVINTAGKTGRPNVDWCEDHKLETIRSNVTGPLVLLEECGKRSIYWAHVSSGCIYQGGTEQLFTEEDLPNFTGSFYSRTKGWVDQILKDFPVLTLRLRMPFDGGSSERTLINKVKKYDKVLDVQNSITYIPDFLNAAQKLIEKRSTGIYNIVNPGTISPYEVMELYKKIVQPDHSFEKLSLEDLSDIVKAGRSNCVLSTKKLEEEGIVFRDIKEVMEEALETMKNA